MAADEPETVSPQERRSGNLLLMIPPRPVLPQKALQRVRAISRVNGWSVIVFATLGTLITLLMGDLSGLAVGVLVGAAGGMEVRGGRMLGRRDPAGMKMLVRSQLFLLAVLLVYCATRLGSFDDATALGNLTPDMEAMLKETGIGKADILPLVRTAFFAIYGGVALGTLLYQGGMALYYRGKTRLVTEALAAPPLPARPRVSPLPPSI